MYGRISGLLPQAGMTPVPRIALKTGADDHFELPLVKTFHDLCEIGNDRAAHSAGAVACSAKCGIAQPACIGRCICLAVLHHIWLSPRRRIAGFSIFCKFRFPCRGCVRFRKFAAGPTVQQVFGRGFEPASEYAAAASAATSTSDAGSLEACCCCNGTHWTGSSARESMTLAASRPAEPAKIPKRTP